MKIAVRYLAVGALILGGLGLTELSLAQTSKETSSRAKEAVSAQASLPAGSGTERHELTGPDLEAFLDGEMPQQLAREDIAGAVIAVVKDGKVIFAKGYGYSDADKRTPVTRDATLFRPGSISKLFTWTSVMQQYEQGKLDLDKDVNEYLDFKIPAAFGKPITLKNIMTHTSGFEETGRNLFVSDAQHMFPLDEYLKGHIPDRIFPPGVVPAYSNYATALAGYIVQRVSGKPLDQYVQDNIYTPLQMTRTTMVQPLPQNLQPMMSDGYGKGSEKPKPFEFVEAYPAGSVSTTAMDMTSFMIAHLQNGQFGDKQILKPETAKLMHSRLYSPDDRLNAMCYGFYEETRNGKRIIGHGGDTALFHSDLHLILEENVGFFVSYNSAGKGELSPRTVLFESFLDRYFPYTPPAGASVADAKQDASEVSGSYKTSRRSESSFMALLTLLGETKVITNEDGTISVDESKGANGVMKKYEEVGPLFYREVHGQDHVAFKKDANGQLQFQIDWPIFIFQRTGFWEGKAFNLTELIFGLGMVILTLLLWPVAAIVRKHYGKPLEYTTAQKKARLLAHGVCLLFVAFYGGWLSSLSLAKDPSGVNALAAWVIPFSILGVFCAIGTIFVCINAYRSFSTSGRWIWTKLQDVALALACLGLVWFAITWKLMNFNPHF